jgi:hypothetical protein
MMSATQLEWYRRMTPRERTRLMLELMDIGWSILRRQGDDSVRRSVAAIATLQRASARALAEGLERARSSHRQAPVQ